MGNMGGCIRFFFFLILPFKNISRKTWNNLLNMLVGFLSQFPKQTVIIPYLQELKTTLQIYFVQLVEVVYITKAL